MFSAQLKPLAIRFCKLIGSFKYHNFFNTLEHYRLPHFGDHSVVRVIDIIVK
jgi:hypothetical protein